MPQRSRSRACGALAPDKPHAGLWENRLVDEIVWVKVTNSRRLAKSHGFYLQHAKEVCLVAKRGADPVGYQKNAGSDIIFAPRHPWPAAPTTGPVPLPQPRRLPTSAPRVIRIMNPALRSFLQAA